MRHARWPTSSPWSAHVWLSPSPPPSLLPSTLPLPLPLPACNGCTSPPSSAPSPSVFVSVSVSVLVSVSIPVSLCLSDPLTLCLSLAVSLSRCLALAPPCSAKTRRRALLQSHLASCASTSFDLAEAATLKLVQNQWMARLHAQRTVLVCAHKRAT